MTARIALANLAFPPTPDASVEAARSAIAEAGKQGAQLLCLPEEFIPGYRLGPHKVAPPDAAFLERGWSAVAESAKRAKIGVILGTERVAENGLRISALVIDRDGTRLGFQDKVQLDPSEDATHAPGTENARRVFTIGDVTFGIAICHEGWRYPETVRGAAQRGAQIVFHPHYHWADEHSYRPTSFADPKNTFHEKALFCRAAENTVWIASVNYASDGSGTTSAFVRPDGSLHSYQPYGEAGLLVADVDLSLSTRLLATRLRA